MKKTFYVASSWTNQGPVKFLAGYLEERGLRWALGHDWTTDSKTERGSPRAAVIADLDLRAAVAADLFVIILTESLSPGCHGEMCARISAGKEVHLIRGDVKAWHPFHEHVGIVQHATNADFVRYVFGA